MMEVDATQSLQFKENLLQGTKAIKTTELIKRLKDLQTELKTLQQEAVDKPSLLSVAKELISNALLKHDNKTVKAITACCLADILRLFAPDAPYTNIELKRAFEFFIVQLKQLTATKDPNFHHFFYLLESLSTVKSIIIIADLDNAEQLSAQLFTDFFSAISVNMPRNVQVCMTDILIQLVEEVGALSQEVIELILDQFLAKEKGASYTMALDICFACTDIFQRRVCQHFTDTLMAFSRSDGSDEELEELKHVHTLIRHIHVIVPNLLLNVVPQLEEEMKVDDDHVRQIATQTLGEMFAEQNTELYQQYPATWKTWLGRRNDKLVSMRMRWLEMCVPVFKNHVALVPELNGCFKAKLSDPEEKVRATACKIIASLDYDLVPSNIDKTVLEQVAMRCKDKKHFVRKEAMSTLGVIYNKTFSSISNNDSDMMDKIGWIPETLLNCLYVDEPAVASSLENALHQYILPEDMNDSERTERLVTVVGALSPRSKTAFKALIQRQKSFLEDMQYFVDMCDAARDAMDTNTTEQNRTEELMKHIAKQFPDKSRTLNSLRRFMEAEETDIVKLLRNCINPSLDYKRIVNAKSSLLKRLEQISPAISEIFELILNRVCPVILNKSNIPYLLRILRATRGRRNTSGEERRVIAQELLVDISSSYPNMFERYAQDLASNIAQQENETIVGDSLELLAQITKSQPSAFSFNRETTDLLMEYTYKGDSKEAEHATIILCNMEGGEHTCELVTQHLFEKLRVNDEQLLTYLSSLKEFALYSPRLFFEQLDNFMRFCNQLIRMKNRVQGDANPEWIEYNALPQITLLKLTGLSALVNYLLGLAKLDQQNDGASTEIFDLLWELVDISCDEAVTENTSAADTSYLRLAASQSILKLIQLKSYEHLLTVPKFEKLGLLLQDSCYYVRLELSETLMKGLQSGEIHARYYTLLFLCAHEPEPELLRQVKYFIRKRATKVEAGQASAIEMSFVRLIHLLAHHPDFTNSTEDLLVFSHYIEFYLSCIATADNASLLYHLAQKIKSSQDMVMSELSQNSYTLSDLSCLLIKRRCHAASWPLNAYPHDISIRSKFYRNLPSGSIQAEVSCSILMLLFISLCNRY
ncbi:armadillo-type protein [Spinellus fusiger]|nr:armadillo-type protein [Spinellus fusiger]